MKAIYTARKTNIAMLLYNFVFILSNSLAKIKIRGEDTQIVMLPSRSIAKQNYCPTEVFVSSPFSPKEQKSFFYRVRSTHDIKSHVTAIQ